jgi:hypothetical protein
MSMFNEGPGKIINASANPIFRLLGLGIVAFVLVMLAFSSVARVESGNVGRWQAERRIRQGWRRSLFP